MEHCEDSVVDVDDNCDIEASISSLFFTVYSFGNSLFFNRSAFLMGSITFMVRR